MARSKRQSSSLASAQSASPGKGGFSSSSKKQKESQELVDAMDTDQKNSLPEDPDSLFLNGDEEEDICQLTHAEGKPAVNKRQVKSKKKEEKSSCRMVGVTIDRLEAHQRWPHRYTKKINKNSSVRAISCTDNENQDGLVQAKFHYLQAEVDGVLYSLNDDAHVQAEDENPNYICKIIELFEGIDRVLYFRAQWFYRAEDTIIGKSFQTTESKRVFLSEVKDDNPLDCLVEKLKIVKVSPNVDVEAKLAAIPECDYYYDMLYLLPYNTFLNASEENSRSGSPVGDSASTISTDENVDVSDTEEASHCKESKASSMKLLDLYCGCGAMSTGLCQGTNIYGLNLVTRWAVDLNEYACESVRLNHPETEVRNEEVGDFLDLIKEWEKLCVSFGLVKGEKPHEAFPMTEDSETPAAADDDDDDDDEEEEEVDDSEVFEVDRILAICYSIPKDQKKRKLYLKVRWKGYGPEEDTWEPVDGLSGCKEKIKEYVTNGFNEKILPLPGDVDVICGGPPCQGISGFNRFRDKNKPLDGDKNSQIEVYMKVVEHLKPKYVLMENVVDLLKFADGFLGRYSLGRLVNMNYQARVGMMVAGAYGLPQFRMRVFIWGARPTETLSRYPLPTHDVEKRGFAPLAFESNVVAYEEGQKVQLQKKLFLSDVFSDLPEVTNYENREKRPYGSKPRTGFQRFIRLKKDASPALQPTLFDHIPLKLNIDDYHRVCQVPKKKGANFRDFPGVRVGPNNVVEWDPDVPRVYLESGKPLVPDYAMSFVNGRSSKPFGRLWWDEIVPTVVTRAEPHNQAILHPAQDRVLTVRENARIQGFPDYYKLQGPIKEKYMQVGNAVAVPVARALGYALGMATRGIGGYEPVFSLPQGFPSIQKQHQPSPTCSEEPASVLA